MEGTPSQSSATTVLDALRPDGPGRPDPDRGVGATLLVAGGRVHDLDAHLTRLTASAREAFGVSGLPDTLPQELSRLGAAGARVRIQVRRDGATRVSSFPFAPPAPGGAPLPLVPFVLPGGFGAHSWNDRRLGDDLRARAGEDAVALVVEPDGEVLEAVGAGVLVVESGRLVGPPLDDRRLPGVSAARLPIGARERLDLDRLVAADAIVLVSSLAGVRPATLTA